MGRRLETARPSWERYTRVLRIKPHDPTPPRLEPGGHAISRCRVTPSHMLDHYTKLFISPGSITQVPKAKQPTDCTWDSLFDTIPPVRPPGINEETLLVLGESVVSVSGDTCSNGSWVFYNTHCVRSRPLLFALAELPLQEESPSKAARIFKIITGGTHAHMTFVILEPWEISASRDERYGMPTLHRDHADSCFGVPPKVRPVDYPLFQIGYTLHRTSTLYSTHSTIAKVGNAHYMRLTLYRSVRRHRRSCWPSPTLTTSATLSTLTHSTTVRSCERSFPEA